jgi:prepilin-type N-terminal cleavage/methylation domain-containing protein
MLNPKKGFTLIELLVVISIIGILSSIILAGLQVSRTQAKNTARNSQVMEYAKALMLYKNQSGIFPGNPLYFYCLGQYPGNLCGDNLTDNHANDADGVKAALNPYLPSFPQITPARSPSGTFTGALYVIQNAGLNATIIWNLDGKSATCARPASTKDFFQTNNLGNDSTNCRVVLE